MVRRKSERVESERNGVLSPKQESAALELARGATVVETARTVEAGVTTIQTWMANTPAFNERVRALRAQLTDCLFAKTVDGMAEAVDTLRKLMNSKSESVRLKACETMLNHGQNAIELQALRQDVDELKRAREK